MAIHIIHVSGKRMIAQGTDGCSIGSLMEGVMTGKDMLTFVDLALNAVQRHPPILDWVRIWMNHPDLVALTPEGWYEEGHGIMGGVLDKHKVWILDPHAWKEGSTILVDTTSCHGRRGYRRAIEGAAQAHGYIPCCDDSPFDDPAMEKAFE
jgi:hypothetical protein